MKLKEIIFKNIEKKNANCPNEEELYERMRNFYKDFLATGILTSEMNYSLQELIYYFNYIMKTKTKIKRCFELYVLWKGAFGTVHRCLDIFSLKSYALKKCLRRQDRSEDHFNSSTLQEIFILITVTLKNPEKLLNVHNIEFCPGNFSSMLMDYGLGDLETFLQYLKEDEKMNLMNSQVIFIENSMKE
jgi:hypothetical protein